uniref:Putative 12-14 kDa mosquito protein n=1 Tax=Psorophora albipes TaxID=869069 RepID=T1DFD3_9DIPT
MFKFKVLFFGIVLIVSKTAVSALECQQCGLDGPEGCKDKGQGEVVTCGQENAEEAQHILTHFYPSLPANVNPNGGYQCVKATHRHQDPDPHAPSFELRGCLYDTKKNFCSIANTFQDGNSTCLACNVDRCNDAAGLKWSFVLLMVGWIVTQFVR